MDQQIKYYGEEQIEAICHCSSAQERNELLVKYKNEYINIFEGIISLAREDYELENDTDYVRLRGEEFSLMNKENQNHSLAQKFYNKLIEKDLESIWFSKTEAYTKYKSILIFICSKMAVSAHTRTRTSLSEEYKDNHEYKLIENNDFIPPLYNLLVILNKFLDQVVNSCKWAEMRILWLCKTKTVREDIIGLRKLFSNIPIDFFEADKSYFTAKLPYEPTKKSRSESIACLRFNVVAFQQDQYSDQSENEKTVIRMLLSPCIQKFPFKPIENNFNKSSEQQFSGAKKLLERSFTTLVKSSHTDSKPLVELLSKLYQCVDNGVEKLFPHSWIEQKKLLEVIPKKKIRGIYEIN